MMHSSSNSATVCYARDPASVLEGYALLAQSALRLPQLAAAFSGMLAVAAGASVAERSRSFFRLLETLFETLVVTPAGAGPQKLWFGLFLHAASNALALLEPGPERLNGAVMLLSQVQCAESNQRLADIGANLKSLLDEESRHRALQTGIVNAGALQPHARLAALGRLLQVWRGAMGLYGWIGIPRQYRPQLAVHQIGDLVVLLRTAIDDGADEGTALLAGDIANMLGMHGYNGILPELLLLLAQACEGVAAAEPERLLRSALASMADPPRDGRSRAEGLPDPLAALHALAPSLRALALIVVAEVLPQEGRRNGLRMRLFAAVDALPEPLRDSTRVRCEQALRKLKRKHS
jgi:plasmid stabilization system protein ParE